MTRTHQRHQELLSRVDIAHPLPVVLRDIARHYSLGRVDATRIITEGYDDLNVLLLCERGQFVVKFFNKGKSATTIQDHVRVLMALSKCEAPIPRILTPNGEAIYHVGGHHGDTSACVSEFFAGENFVKRAPQHGDVLAVTRFLATLHQMPLKVERNYDSWGTLNLPREFELKKPAVGHETVQLVAPLAGEVSRMRFGNAQRRIIHGDLQRKHVLKNGSGAYCILDFGCIDYSYPIVDLAIFLALFCLEGIKQSDARGVIDDVLESYSAQASLPARHIALLGPLIRATWASYLLIADYLIRQGDRSDQTRRWYRFALDSLRAYAGGL